MYVAVQQGRGGSAAGPAAHLEVIGVTGAVVGHQRVRLQTRPGGCQSHDCRDQSALLTACSMHTGN
jgi:hypothetical protein